MQARVTYRVPAGWPTTLSRVSSRVEAPFGKRRVMGVVVKTDTKPTEDGIFELKNLTAGLRRGTTRHPERLLELALWVADYYIEPPSARATRLVAPRPAACARSEARRSPEGPGLARGASPSFARLRRSRSGSAGAPRSGGPDVGGGPQASAARQGHQTARLLQARREGPHRSGSFDHGLPARPGERPASRPKPRFRGVEGPRPRSRNPAQGEAAGAWPSAIWWAMRRQRRQALKSLEKKGLVTIGLEVAERRPPTPSSERARAYRYPRPRPRGAHPVHPRAVGGPRHEGRGGGARRLPPVPAPRRDRERQDRGLPARRPARARGRRARWCWCPRWRSARWSWRPPRASGARRRAPLDLSVGERRDQWLAQPRGARRGGGRALGGVRAAADARPHRRGRGARPAYKQSEMLRYHGRDVAVRARAAARASRSCWARPPLAWSRWPTPRAASTACCGSPRAWTAAVPLVGSWTCARRARAATRSCRGRCARRSPSGSSGGEQAVCSSTAAATRTTPVPRLRLRCRSARTATSRSRCTTAPAPLRCHYCDHAQTAPARCP